MRKIKIGDVSETVVERSDYPPERIRSILGKETVAVLGYGVQGRGQSLNMKDNGVNVIVGMREEGKGWELAKQDGWQPGTTLFPLDEAARRGTIVQYLLSDAGQKDYWPKLKSLMTAGKGINSSYAVHQDATGRALDRCLACGIAIGSGYLFETTFKQEVVSDLTGERGVLMGAIYGLWLAQYEVLREHGHSPSEAFNETVEEATQSLYPLIAENGMDWMYANCSTTAQRGALDWFKKFRDASKPVFEELYQKVAAGEETRRVLEANSRKDYREQLEKELKAVADSEMWQAGTVVRSLRPERAAKSKG